MKTRFCTYSVCLLGALLAFFALSTADHASGGAATAHEISNAIPLSYDADVRDFLPEGVEEGINTIKGVGVNELLDAQAGYESASVPLSTNANGYVRPNHSIKAGHFGYVIFNQFETELASFTENQLFQLRGENDSCSTGLSQGEPIALYDPHADRWILTHFTKESDGSPLLPFYQCIAVSKSSDLLAGGWWLYVIEIDPLAVDAPLSGAHTNLLKFGVWPDCIAMDAGRKKTIAWYWHRLAVPISTMATP